MDDEGLPYCVRSHERVVYAALVCAELSLFYPFVCQLCSRSNEPGARDKKMKVYQNGRLVTRNGSSFAQGIEVMGHPMHLLHLQRSAAELSIISQGKTPLYVVWNTIMSA
nr:hypothetical protein [Tanacetum cinerariifolium]